MSLPSCLKLDMENYNAKSTYDDECLEKHDTMLPDLHYLKNYMSHDDTTYLDF